MRMGREEHCDDHAAALIQKITTRPHGGALVEGFREGMQRQTAVSFTDCSTSGGGEDNKEASPWPREHMFDKAVTPSDVGKLNRLVIPKLYAEKYLPMDTDAKEEGLLLSFEDSTGKLWRFRYSYWNSSQSYVLTKGWSRFVKEMKLNTGDIVSFHRTICQGPNPQRLFISCRHKPCSAAQLPVLPGSIGGRPFQLRSPFQFAPDATNNIAGCHFQQLVTSRKGPQWTRLSWPANNVIGSPAVPKSRTLQTNAKPVDLVTSWQFIAIDENARKRKGIHDPGFPFSIQRSRDTTDCGRYAADIKNWLKAPPLRATHLEAPGSFPDDPSAAASFDHSTSTSTCASTSKQVVRLFGVNLECGNTQTSILD